MRYYESENEIDRYIEEEINEIMLKQIYQDKLKNIYKKRLSYEDYIVTFGPYVISGFEYNSRFVFDENNTITLTLQKKSVVYDDLIFFAMNKERMPLIIKPIKNNFGFFVSASYLVGFFEKDAYHADFIFYVDFENDFVKIDLDEI